MSLLQTQSVLPQRQNVTRAPLQLVNGIIQPLSRSSFAFLCMFLAGIGVMMHLVVQTQISQGAFTEKTLTADVRTSVADVQRLQQQISVMSASANLAARAQALGMVEIPSPAFLRLSDGQVMGQAAAAKAGEDAPNVIKALAPSDVALTKDASQVLDISQIPVDDSAVKISSSRS